ncbi:50S ribosomal protein L25 [Paenibacillus mucilaginosus]|uniref:Large ribosomal subunit protein bL25 n=3 Tax=Paenibacillus mucilaginosus TaxID=61624 RepID=H6NSG9_9BACL|nr:50S ribosomal protein L25 [Paenibacillus mucilaginosus]AEI46091.1 ribosomal protein L25 [Paenibacillus mucilaginosus KNP414]AFC33719.1 ribosomal protein L25 [Paenibacillus mucilaginosus 3016]AFH66052.1 50S ribosomal protein L25 [Paenibacillus mucilaginosus K02]MCG7217946.1 50S ribosomal protein L25 [Paenibacillus mucilaginosus]WDM27432.1 50S ribosomal protein L25 [Paenibacillus mucilaginosus]
MPTTLKAEVRTTTTKGERNQLRAQGMVPGVVYGKKVSQTSIAIDQKELVQLLKSNPHAIIDMEVPEFGKQPVMISEVQRDKLSRKVLHVDFHQINMDEPVNTTVRIEFIGEPQGVSEGGILQIQRHELDIRCLPRDIPASIEIDISALNVGENKIVSELQLPANIELKTDENDVIATILTPQKEVEETVEAEEAVAEAAPEEPAAEEAAEEKAEANA